MRKEGEILSIERTRGRCQIDADEGVFASYVIYVKVDERVLVLMKSEQ